MHKTTKKTTQKNIKPPKKLGNKKSLTTANIIKNQFELQTKTLDLESTDIDYSQENIPKRDVITISEKIHPDDTIATFYNRVQNYVFEKLEENPKYNFLLIIESRLQELNDSQIKIINEPIPSNYEIPLICQPFYIPIGVQSLPPIKFAKLIDNGFYTYEINFLTGVKKNSDTLLSLYDETRFYIKRTDDHGNDKKIHSYILTSILYESTNVKMAIDDYPNDWQLLLMNGFVNEEEKLTKDGLFASQFEDLLFYEYVVMISFMNSQDEKDRISSFLFSLLILQIIRYGDELITNYFSDSFIDNFDERSDLITLIKVLFPLLKYDQNNDGFCLHDEEEYLQKGLDPSKSETIINFIVANFRIYINYCTDSDGIEDEDEFYNVYCNEVDKLENFLSDLYLKINEIIKIIELKLPEFYSSHLFSFIGIEKELDNSIRLAGNDDSSALLYCRPGWHCYSFPKNVFAFCVTEYNEITVSLIHSIVDEMEINVHPVPEELDNVFAMTVINSIIDQSIFSPFFHFTGKKADGTFAYIKTVKANKSFISYRPLTNSNKKCITEIDNVLNLIKIINPFLPRSLLLYNRGMSLIIELQSSGLSNIHSRVYSTIKKKKKKKSMKDTDEDEYSFDYPFFKSPYVYHINKKSLTFLWNNVNELKGFSPSIRIALTANDFMNFGISKEINESPFSIPTIDINSKSVFDYHSQLFILSDNKKSELGSYIEFPECKNSPSTQNIYHTISLALPETAKISYSYSMFIVQRKNSFILIQFDDAKDKDKLSKLLGIENLFSPTKKPSIFKLNIPLIQFIEELESQIFNDDQIPHNIQILSDSNDHSNKFRFFLTDDIANELKVSQEDFSLRLLGKEESSTFSDLLFFKFPKSNDYDTLSSFNEDNVRDAIEKCCGDVEISPVYNLITFSIDVNEHQGINLKDQYSKIESKVYSKISPFLFNKISTDPEMQDDKFPELGKVKFEVFSEKVSIAAAQFLTDVIKGEKLTKPFEIDYIHPSMKKHQRTQEDIDNWVIANNCDMKKEGTEWVGSLSAVSELSKQFKIDLENKVFNFDYQPFYVPYEKFKGIRKSFEKVGFQDFEYNKLYEMLIIKPENFDDHGIDVNENKFCLRICKGSNPYKKRLSVYDVNSEDIKTCQISFCTFCTSKAVKERTKDYFQQFDLMNDYSKIIFASQVEENKLETVFKPLDLILKQEKLREFENYSIPIGQFLWFLSELSDNGLNKFIRAWVNMAAEVAIYQCPMITACPKHLSQIVKLSKSCKEKLKCSFDDQCENYFHMKCLRWHNEPSKDEDDEKETCEMKSIGFKAIECPNCKVPTFNLFNNVVMFCDRCGCNWCYLCQVRLAEEKVLRHIKEFHNGHYNY
ncbi:hypothetical protein M9Y10_043714 [Tritrichomonas musculus]|uniref:RING-type domain-containing protein n=1 Tax=Tritrichomonas musculus TaxID=1915356 RepID=A0ABR2K1H6_9EUKA